METTRRESNRRQIEPAKLHDTRKFVFRVLFQLATILTRVIDVTVGWIPLTLAGYPLVLALFWIRNAYGIEHKDQVVLGLASVGVAMVMIGVFSVVLTALWLRVRPAKHPMTPLAFEVGQSTLTGYKLGWSRWNLWVRVEIAWERPVHVNAEWVRNRMSWVEQVTVTRRSHDTQIVRRFVVTDIFGLSRIRFRRTTNVEVTVFPSRGQFHVGLVNSQEYVPGDQISHPEGPPGGDRVEMRRYIPGDSLKLVLWKVYARTGQLLIRTPERAVTISQRTMLHLVASPDDEAAAGLCRAWLEDQGRQMEFVFGCDSGEAPTQDFEEALRQIAGSSAAQNNGALELTRTLALGAANGFRSILLFVPPTAGKWLERLTEQLRAHKDAKRALIGIDDPGPTSHHGSRWLYTDGYDPHSTVNELGEVIARLNAAGIETTIVDRISGEIRQLDDLSSPKAMRGHSQRRDVPEQVA